METKKNPKVDLTRKTSFFFSIALLITMSLVLTAFEWRQHEAKLDDLVQRSIDPFEMDDVPPTEILPPPPPTPPAPVIVEVPNEEEITEDIKVNLDIEVSAETVLKHTEFVPETPEENPDVPFIAPESPASFDGGYDAFYRFVSSKIKYPAQARRMGIEGKVYVEFVVNRDGTLTELSVLKGIGGGCDEEAVRVVQNSPPWNPGKQRGVPVRQKMVLPIVFELN